VTIATATAARPGTLAATAMLPIFRWPFRNPGRIALAARVVPCGLLLTHANRLVSSTGSCRHGGRTMTTR
jgi:hypothetical protein